MTALVLVVDDLAPNLKLLEAKLTAEYYDVITATNGFEAIEQAQTNHPDIILLDVMMPGMDGFETCKKLKADPKTSHIPVVMVTALNEPSDRVRGLESGADDFLTKPINDTALFARVSSLVRLKIMIDELRLRDQTNLQLGEAASDSDNDERFRNARILVVDDDIIQGEQVIDNLEQHHQATLLDDVETTVAQADAGGYDLIIVSTQMIDADGLRICSQLRSQEATRHVPLLMLVDEDDQHSLIKGLEMGINDYIISPIDFNELTARVRTQIKRKVYQDALKKNYRQSISMAITDNLTGLYNRHYLSQHLDSLVKDAHVTGKPLSLAMMDMDHFKLVNDTYGHQAGDEVLVELSRRITNSIRGSDLAARFGGEEFVIVMPDTPLANAKDVAERLRCFIEFGPFLIQSHEVGSINKTISIGMAGLRTGEDAESLMKRADLALYEAKENGRNKVCLAA